MQVVPSFITTTQAALDQFSPEQRKCYTCQEINLMFLPYKSDDPESCEQHGSRYSMSNCVFEAAFEVSRGQKLTRGPMSKLRCL